MLKPEVEVKQLIALFAASVVGVVTLAFVIKIAIYILQGRPIAHVSGIRFTLLHDILMVLALLIAVASCIGWWILSWHDPENLVAWIFKWRRLK